MAAESIWISCSGRELEHQQVPDAGLVNFGTMPGLVSYENADSAGRRPPGGCSSRSEGGGGIPSHCIQEEVQNLGDKRGCLSGELSMAFLSGSNFNLVMIEVGMTIVIMAT